MFNKEKRAKRIENNKKKAKNLNSISNYDPKQDAIIIKAPKNWKHQYTRSSKMKRAKQLGFDYPRKSTRQLLDSI